MLIHESVLVKKGFVNDAEKIESWWKKEWGYCSIFPMNMPKETIK